VQGPNSQAASGDESETAPFDLQPVALDLLKLDASRIAGWALDWGLDGQRMVKEPTELDRT
jgi:hypothetical protein